MKEFAVGRARSVAIQGARRAFCPSNQPSGCPVLVAVCGGWRSRALTRHGMPQPWQFHGWAAPDSPRHVHRGVFIGGWRAQAFLSLEWAVPELDTSCPLLVRAFAPSIPTRSQLFRRCQLRSGENCSTASPPDVRTANIPTQAKTRLEWATGQGAMARYRPAVRRRYERSMRHGLGGVGRLGRRGGGFVVFENSRDFAEEALLFLGVLVIWILVILWIGSLHRR